MVFASLWLSEPGLQLKFNLFGQSYPGEIHSWLSVAVCGLAAIMAGASYGLLWGRRQGRLVGLAVCYGYLLFCVVSFFLKLRTGSVTFDPFQPAVFAGAIFSLHRVKRDWNAPPVLPRTITDQADPVAG
jgi:hypothetical protein